MIGMTSNSTNFGSRPLHNVNLRNAEGSFVPAVISELDPKDAVDIEAMRNIRANWKKALYVGDIAYYFKEASQETIENEEISRFYAVELHQPKLLQDKIVGLINVFFEKGKNNLDLSWLQVKPELMHKNKSTKREIRGIGELLTAKAFSVANDFKASILSITPANDFYEKSFEKPGVKLSSNELGCFIDHPYFNQYLKYIEKKYDITF